MTARRTPNLDHVATMRIQLGERLRIGAGGLGTRMVAEIVGVDVDGPRLRATMAGAAAADWLTVSPDGSYGTLDVRMTLRTDGDDLIFVEYSGRIDLAGGGVAVAAPTMQTGSADHDWVNRAQFIAVGDKAPDGLVYELYEVAAPM